MILIKKEKKCTYIVKIYGKTNLFSWYHIYYSILSYLFYHKLLLLIIYCPYIKLYHIGKTLHIYIYIYIMRIVHQIRRILPKELVIGSIVYSYTFFKEINCDGFLHVPEDCQHGLLYWLLCLKHFLYWRVSVFPLHRQSFQLLAHSV